MKMIRVRYYGPSLHKGARFVASDGETARISRAYSYDDMDTEAAAIAKELADKLGWCIDLRINQFKGDYFFTCVPKADLVELEKLANSILMSNNVDPTNPTVKTIHNIALESLKMGWSRP